MEDVRSKCNMKIFVDTDDDMRLARRIKRDTIDRGRDVNGVIEQYTRFVKPMFDAYVSPSKKHADVIIPWVRPAPGAPQLGAAPRLRRHGRCLAPADSGGLSTFAAGPHPHARPAPPPSMRRRTGTTTWLLTSSSRSARWGAPPHRVVRPPSAALHAGPEGPRRAVRCAVV